MRVINKILMSCLTMLFSWQYGAHAFHYNQNLSADCDSYCSQYGEKSGVSAGLFPNYYGYDYGKFGSCHCFTSAEISLIRNCYNKACTGANMTGTMRAYIYVPASSMWCSMATEGAVENCVCKSGYYNVFYSNGQGLVCNRCIAGHYCTGGKIFSCSRGYYSNAGASSCSKCPDNPPATSASAADGINKCYWPANVTISDASGDYLFTNNCFFAS